MIKNGTRLKSQVCETQVIIVRSSETLDDLRAGGAPMIPVGDEVDASLKLDDGFSGGTQMGKRYVDDAGAEVLVTKAGAGSLSVGSTPLTCSCHRRHRFDGVQCVSPTHRAWRCRTRARPVA